MQHLSLQLGPVEGWIVDPYLTNCQWVAQDIPAGLPADGL
jgi:hypothetical protein